MTRYEFSVVNLWEYDIDKTDDSHRRRPALEQLKDELNRLGGQGWHVVSDVGEFYLLEREIRSG